MPSVRESIQMFLRARATDANRDLIDRWTPAMETQVNVRAGSGEPVDGRRNTWTDGYSTWHHIRVPKNADSDPAWREYPIGFPLDLHADGIGCTGWDWEGRQSRWVGFDFDSITGHAAGIGVTAEELDRIRAAAEALPFVEVRRSTGGNGLHFYVYLDAIPTANHTEHAALARCILGMMSSATAFDFASQIDSCGGNMWIWHRKMSADNHGLEIVKKAAQTLSVADLPANWKDHIEVVTRRRAKLRIGPLKDEHEDPFELLASSRRLVPLDDSHKAIIEELTHSGFSTIWVPDYHLLQTHTKALQGLAENPDLKIKGIFKTISAGKHPATCNCFCFPMDDGAWHVYRFSPGVPEADTWSQDGAGWTCCHFNKSATLDLAVKLAGGQEAPNGKGFAFSSSEQAAKALEILGQTAAIPDDLQGRETWLKPQKDGRVAVSIRKAPGEKTSPEGWINGRGFFERVLAAKIGTKATSRDDQEIEFDKVVRTLVTTDNKSAGWRVKTEDGDWHDRSKDDVKDILSHYGKAKAEIDAILGAACIRPWKLVTLPFQPEYPGNRRWNQDAAQYRCQPVEGEHPHWDKVLAHCFGDLDAAIKEDPVARRAGIGTGADYGLLWTAFALREPYKKLPYLFLYGDEVCGKSTFHESFGYLLTKGLVSAGLALRSQNDFNGELAGGIIAYIDEVNIAETRGALEKIKTLVTSEVQWIRKMRTDPYPVPNTLHFIQTANNSGHCPVLPGDTRITVVHVPPLGTAEIPSEVMKKRLEEESSHFLWTLLNLKLPPPEGRLCIPVIETERKARIQQTHHSPLDQFLAENTHRIPGAKVLLSDFHDRFTEWLTAENRAPWSKRQILRELPHQIPHGVYSGNVKWIGNLSWEPNVPASAPWIEENGRLRQG